jgi:toxin ParE1/3/4
MISVSFHRLAAWELREAERWYAARDASVAVRFVQAVDAAVARIRQDPDAQPVEWKSFRWVRVRRFPYRLLFERRDASGVLIIAVAHTSRRPRYWRRRK